MKRLSCGIELPANRLQESVLMEGALREREVAAKLRNRAWLNCYVKEKLFCALQERDEAAVLRNRASG